MTIKLEDFEEYLGAQFRSINFAPIIPAIRMIVDGSIQRNFQATGRYGNGRFGGGSSKWKLSNRVKNNGGQTLSDESNLKQSITVDVRTNSTGVSISIGSNSKYAAIMNFGFDGTQSVKSHTRKIKKTGTEYSVGSFSRKMKIDARPFLVLQEEDIDEIKDLILNHILKSMQSF